MATRFTSSVVSAQENYSYAIAIADADHVGASTIIDTVSLNFSWKPETDEIFCPIITSECRLVLSIDNGTKAQLIEDMAGAAEGRFRIKVTKGGTLYWVGYILSDLATREDTYYPYDFEVRATDGIGRLKDIDYNNAGTPYAGKETILNHIYNVLGKIGLADGKIGLADFYTTETYLQTVADFWAESQSALTQADADPLAINRFKHRAYIIVDDKGNQTFNSAFDVLKDIMTAIGARFIYSEGSYKIIQVPQYAENGVVRIRNYQKNKTKDADITSVNLATWRSTVSDPGPTGLVKLNRGQEKWFPALKQVKFTYKHFAATNYLSGQSWSSSVNPAVTIEDVDSNNGAAQLEYYGTLFYTLGTDSYTQYNSLFLKWRFRIKLGTYYLRRTYTFTNGSAFPDSINGEWVDGLAYWEYVIEIPTGGTQSGQATPQDSINGEWVDGLAYWEYVIEIPTGGTQSGQATPQPAFISPELPTTADMEIQFLYVETLDPNGNTVVAPGGGNPTPSWTLNENYLATLYDGILEEAATGEEYYWSNTNGGNSKDIEAETYIGTGPVLNAYGALEADADGVNTWAEATGYEYPFGDGTYFDLGKIIAREMVAIQSKPAKRLLYQFWGAMEAHHKIRIELSGPVDESSIMLSVKFDAKTDLWDGEWVVISRVAGAPVVGNNPQVTIRDDIRIQQVSKPGKVPFIGAPYLPTESVSERVRVGTFNNQNQIAELEGAISAGDNVTSITVDALKAPLFSGDTVQVLDTSSGAFQDFEVAADSAIGDTSITVKAETAANDLGADSIVTVTQPEVLNKIPRRYKEPFSVSLVEGVTVTKNAGNLPVDTDNYLDVYYNGQLLTQDVDYAVHSRLLLESGDDLLLESGDFILTDDADINFVTNGDRDNAWKANGRVIVKFWDAKNI